MPQKALPQVSRGTERTVSDMAAYSARCGRLRNSSLASTDVRVMPWPTRAQTTELSLSHLMNCAAAATRSGSASGPRGTSQLCEPAKVPGSSKICGKLAT